MGMSDATPRTNAVLNEILDRDGYIDGGNAPQLFTSLARNLERELAEANARLQNIPALLENNAKLRRELAEANAYADKLAQGLPCLPADVENLRKANLDLANELAEAKKDSELLDWLLEVCPFWYNNREHIRKAMKEWKDGK